jgi:superfamily I DNA/RNA helicase
LNIRGRSRNLRVNYRTWHQIREQADRLLGPEVTDVDGNRENRADTISVFNGPRPVVLTAETESAEQEAVARFLKDQTASGVAPHECAVFVRSEQELSRAKAAVQSAGQAFRVLDEHLEIIPAKVSIGTMHLAKGLEFRVVVAMVLAVCHGRRFSEPPRAGRHLDMPPTH